MRILLIEDEKDVAESIRDSLKNYYIVDIRNDGTEGEYEAYANDYDLIILDYVLPDMSGVDVCKKIRENKIDTPILFLTGKYNIRDRVESLNAGADDYVTKPFSSKELFARIKALLRRGKGKYEPNIVSIANITIDTMKRVVTRDNKRIKLRRKEFDLLEYMLRNRNRVLTRSMILENVWENGIEEYSNTVDVHIKYLRDKIDRPFNTKLIETIHGIGYKLKYEPD